MTKQGHIFKIFPLLGLTSIHIGSLGVPNLPIFLDDLDLPNQNLDSLVPLGKVVPEGEQGARFLR